MDNTTKLRDSGILKDYTVLEQRETDAVDSLTEDDIDLAISTHNTPKNVVTALFPMAGVGTHHVVGEPDEEGGEPGEG